MTSAGREALIEAMRLEQAKPVERRRRRDEPPRSCTECDRPANARNLCPTHYSRWRKTGTTSAPVPRTREPRTLGRVVTTDHPIYAKQIDPGAVNHQRFWKMVDKLSSEKGCWLWTGSTKSSYGYGLFRLSEGNNVRPHRVSYTLAKGAIPDGLVVDHLCRVRNCVNPEHLEAVTVRVNNLRGEGLAADGARAFAEGRCVRGHDLAVVGMRKGGKGSRVCGECARDHVRSYREKKAQ